MRIRDQIVGMAGVIIVLAGFVMTIHPGLRMTGLIVVLCGGIVGLIGTFVQFRNVRARRRVSRPVRAGPLSPRAAWVRNHRGLILLLILASYAIPGAVGGVVGWAIAGRALGVGLGIFAGCLLIWMGYLGLTVWARRRRQSHPAIAGYAHVRRRRYR